MTIRPLVPLPIVFVVASAAVFLIALAVVPPFGVTFDESKYLGIGYSMIEGQGPQVVFGGYFLPHAPVWPTVVVAPAVALGIDPLVVGRTFNALAGVGLIVLSAALAWRVNPTAAAFAAIALLATTYLHELTRTARLDVPAATLAVAYLALGLVAVRRGSVRLSIAAGLLFAMAFLVKEIVLPLGPVPVLAAILHRRPWGPILRSAGWLTLVATLGVAPWFIFVADVSDRVYRLGTPGWTLLPIGLALLLVGVVAVIAARVEAPEGLRVRIEGPARTWLVVGVTIIWVACLTLVFTRTLGTRGTALFDIPQIIGYVQRWYPYLVTTAIGAVGLMFLFLAPREPDRGRREASEDLWLATICGLPLVILVIGVGEPPRNYLAQVAIGAGIAGAGWLWTFETALRRWPALTILVVGALFGPVFGLVIGDRFGIDIRYGAVAGSVVGLVLAATVVAAHRSDRLRAGRGPSMTAVTGLLVITLVGASGLLVFTIGLREMTFARETAVDTVAAWAKKHVQPGSTIAFGSDLSYQMALPLRRDFNVRQVRHQIVVSDVDAPDGVAVFGKPMAEDWVSIDIQPRNINEFQAFSASRLIAQLRTSEVAYWVYSTGNTSSAPTIIPALEGAAGFEQVAHWAFPRPRGGPIDTYVYQLDLDRLALNTGRLHIAPDALERMVMLVESKRATLLARRLAAQVVADPRSAATDILIDRLRVLGQS